MVRFLPMEELIAAFLNVLFPGLEIVEHHAFRITRNADFEVEEDRDEDLLQALERELARRRFGSPVRLEVADDMTENMLELLLRELDVHPGDVIEVPGLLDLSSLWQIYGVDRPALKDPPFVPATPPAFGERETPKSIFSTLRDGDVLVHHPYDSFSTTVQRFIEQAAADPNVLAIKQTLYRTSGDSPIVNALIDAAEAGKQVVALVEIKARFDEQANIKWARALEQAGVHVVYGLIGLKTHCKTCLVVRREGSTIRRYCHIGTGNYNPKTARLYEDVGLLTAAPDIGADLTDLFNSLTGYSRKVSYRNLLVAPHGVRKGIIERIEREIAATRDGADAQIRLKANALVDEQVIDALYRASQAGVRVEVVVRGICALRPGAPGYSENIVVRSILGRFLEHSRIIHFRAIDEFWIGSADMMHRNLDRRVEVMAQVKDPRLTAQLNDVFESAMDPATRCWELGRRRSLDGVAAGGPHRTRPPGVVDGTPSASVRLSGVGRPGPNDLQELRCRRRIPPDAAPASKAVLAAGAVLWRSNGDPSAPEVAIIHRPRYDDWSLPKGKVDPGETEPVTAVREVHEETGYSSHLGRRLAAVSYPVEQGIKKVRYWAARCVDGGAFTPNVEVDELDLAARRRGDEATGVPTRPKSVAPLRQRPGRHPDGADRAARDGG